jgi:hypothetical protein
VATYPLRARRLGWHRTLAAARGKGRGARCSGGAIIAPRAQARRARPSERGCPARRRASRRGGARRAAPAAPAHGAPRAPQGRAARAAPRAGQGIAVARASSARGQILVLCSFAATSPPDPGSSPIQIFARAQISDQMNMPCSSTSRSSSSPPLGPLSRGLFALSFSEIIAHASWMPA